MQNTIQPRRFPSPWTAKQLAECFVVEDGEGKRVAFVYFDANKMKAAGSYHHLTQDEARRIALGIARLPKLLSE